MTRHLLPLSLLLLCAPSPRNSPFLPPRVVDLGPTRQPRALASGDFNSDGTLDLVVGSDGADDVLLLLGDGRGGLHRAAAFPAGVQPTEIKVADLDRDGRLDLAIANHGT